ncbi:MAG: hypothetical protein AAF570_21370, partial [Bacteroidota bacterium]
MKQSLKPLFILFFLALSLHGQSQTTETTPAPTFDFEPGDCFLIKGHEDFGRAVIFLEKEVTKHHMEEYNNQKFWSFITVTLDMKQTGMAQFTEGIVEVNCVEKFYGDGRSQCGFRAETFGEEGGTDDFFPNLIKVGHVQLSPKYEYNIGGGYSSDTEDYIHMFSYWEDIIDGYESVKLKTVLGTEMEEKNDPAEKEAEDPEEDFMPPEMVDFDYQSGDCFLIKGHEEKGRGVIYFYKRLVEDEFGDPEPELFWHFITVKLAMGKKGMAQFTEGIIDLWHNEEAGVEGGNEWGLLGESFDEFGGPGDFFKHLVKVGHVDIAMKYHNEEGGGYSESTEAYIKKFENWKKVSEG